MRTSNLTKSLAASFVAAAGMICFSPNLVFAESQNAQAPAALSIATNGVLLALGPGIFELGKVRFDKNARTIQFPGRVNMDKDLIEYLLVHSSGKLHESLLQTEAEPYHVHLAFLLISQTNHPSNSAIAQRRNSEIEGRKLEIWISWKTNRVEKRARAEDLIYNLESRSPMSKGLWVYNGSGVKDGVFLAQRDGSLVAVYFDPDALINTPRPGREKDDIWLVNHTNTPSAGTPVQIMFQMKNEPSIPVP